MRLILAIESWLICDIYYVFDRSCLHECCDDLVSHVDVDEDTSKEGEGSARLRDDEEVDNGVENTGANKDPWVRDYWMFKWVK